MDGDGGAVVEAWAWLGAGELGRLRALIRTHDQRLRGVDPDATAAAVADAVFAAVERDPALAAACRRAVRLAAARRIMPARRR